MISRPDNLEAIETLARNQDEATQKILSLMLKDPNTPSQAKAIILRYRQLAKQSLNLAFES